MTSQTTRTASGSSVPSVTLASKAASPAGKVLTGHNLFMMACCAAMVAGTGILIAAAPAGQTIGQTLLYAAPMLGCVGMHLVMHRLMGKSCHAQAGKEKNND
ncbi:DUF2933 domain-containing protein [Roseibium sp. Sym1]|uniref:DUF2933 domain-containing protein n=1 Tax=Roseibium sp. Sym1 TaxID=3016006 RepID=UPI0022B541ED|nr:DUF2933 domain-containing protein [Roseibium sp. Sym1]